MAFIQKRVPGTGLGTGTPWGPKRSLPAHCWPSRRTAPDSWAGLIGVSTSAVPAATPCPGHSDGILWEPLNRETCFCPCQQGCHNSELSIPCKWWKPTKARPTSSRRNYASWFWGLVSHHQSPWAGPHTILGLASRALSRLQERPSPKVSRKSLAPGACQASSFIQQLLSTFWCGGSTTAGQARPQPGHVHTAEVSPHHDATRCQNHSLRPSSLKK